jgi:hypothetical protein
MGRRPAGRPCRRFRWWGDELDDGRRTAVASVVVLARQSIGYTVAVGAAVGLTAGVTAGLIAGSSIGVGGGPRFGLVVGSVVALTFGLSVGLWPGQGRVWLRYAFGVRSAARRGLLPARPAVFLDWCLDAGLMRFAGTELQSRHRRLQQALVTTSASDNPGHPEESGQRGSLQ